MATKKKMNEEVQAPEVGMTTEQTMEQTVPEREEEHVEEAREQTPETMEATEAPADTEKDVASAKKNVGPGAGKSFRSGGTGTVCLRGSRRRFCALWTGRTTSW